MGESPNPNIVQHINVSGQPPVHLKHTKCTTLGAVTLCIIYVTFPEHKTILKKNAKVNIYFKKCLSSLPSCNSHLVLQVEALSGERAVFAEGTTESGQAAPRQHSWPPELSLGLSGSRNMWGQRAARRPLLCSGQFVTSRAARGWLLWPCGPSETDRAPSWRKGNPEPFS